MTLKLRLLRAERGLERDEDGVMWVFPEDYPQRIKAIIEGILGKVRGACQP